nr:hypothetical protein HmN_000500700 [Hymenolepis microstoma]
MLRLLSQGSRRRWYRSGDGGSSDGVGCGCIFSEIGLNIKETPSHQPTPPQPPPPPPHQTSRPTPPPLLSNQFYTTKTTSIKGHKCHRLNIRPILQLKFVSKV